MGEATNGRLRVVITAGRYGFAFGPEQAVLARYPALDVELRGVEVRGEAELIEAGQDADALCVSTLEAVPRRVIAALPRTRVIARYGVGVDNIDLDAATDHGIVVTHYPQYCTDEVADHAVALMLALNRRLVDLDRDLRRGAWVAHRHHTQDILRGPVPPLREMTLGIVGFGRIGRAVAARARPFGLTLLVADPAVPDDTIRTLAAAPVGLDELLGRSDIVSLHCPLLPSTRGLIGAERLARMKPTAMLVNTARGPIVDLDALAAALATGRLGGAALDVTDPEPLPAASPLYGLPNTILTPHAAYYSERSVEIVRDETLAAALAVLAGRRPDTVANPAVLDRVALAP